MVYVIQVCSQLANRITTELPPDKLLMFQTVPLSIIRSSSMYTQQWYVSYRFADSLRAESGRNWSCSQAVNKPVWHTPLLCVQWKTPDDGQRNCPKHVEFYSKNKFEKLVHLVAFIIRNKLFCVRLALLMQEVERNIQRTFINCNTARFNPSNAELNPIYHLLTLLEAHHFLHVSRVRVK